jgi:hypothetical protein
MISEEYEMDLYLQVGYGMMSLCQSLTKRWGTSITVLSPRDLTEKQMLRFSANLRKLGGSVLLDPQFYWPRADHHRLTSQCYWPDEFDTTDFAGSECLEMIKLLADLNSRLVTTHMIVPGRKADTVDLAWLDSQSEFLEAARSATDLPLIATVCLSADAVHSLDQLSLIVEQAEQTSVDGYYLVAETSGNSYIIDDPVWMSNMLDLVVGLRRTEAKVIVGYSNQQHLIMACAKASAIAAGKWRNVRSFSTRRFKDPEPSAPKQRAKWYYNPQTFSEYTLPYLDMAYRAGMKTEMLQSDTMSFSVAMLDVPEPTASGWTEAIAAEQMLCTLREQALRLSYETFDETIQAYRAWLDQAEDLASRFRQSGVYGGDRDFRDAIPANRSALVYLENTHGPTLKRIWPGLD